MLDKIALELFAMELFNRAMDNTPKTDKGRRLERPLWTQIGTALRNSYRIAAHDLLRETGEPQGDMRGVGMGR